MMILRVNRAKVVIFFFAYIYMEKICGEGIILGENVVSPRSAAFIMPSQHRRILKFDRKKEWKYNFRST
jgi:hypothetical protein